MKCEEAMALILEGATGGTELKGHIAKCPQCASMARQWLSLRESVSPRASASFGMPPLEIDVKIHMAALLKAQSIRRKRVFVKIFSGFAAAAALAAITISVALYMPSSENSGSKAGVASVSGANSAKRHSGVDWDSVALNEGLTNLSHDIESTTDLIPSFKREAKQGQPDIDSSLQALSVDVPDLLT